MSAMRAGDTEEYVMRTRTKLLIALVMAIALSCGFYGLDQFNRMRFAGGVHFYEISHNIPIMTGWVWVYFAYFPLCFLPLAFKKIRNDSDIFRRVSFGFSLQFMVAFLIFFLVPVRMAQPVFETVTLSGRALAWLHRVDVGFNVFPSLHVSNIFFIAVMLGKVKGRLWCSALMFVTVIVGISTVLVGQHCIPDALAGAVLGVLSYKAAFSEPAAHLLSSEAPRYIAGQLRNLWNLWIRNSPMFWDKQYRSGYWEFLRSADQRPRYYTIQGLVSEYFPEKCDLLDVGCGEGILHEFLKDKTDFYEGVDCAKTAIRVCETNCSKSGNTAFHVTTFEQFRPSRKYDVIIFNEMLYYLPIKEAVRAFEAARKYLRNAESMIVVSMNSNSKSQWIYRKIESISKPSQSIRVENALTGSFWTIKAFS